MRRYRPREIRVISEPVTFKAKLRIEFQRILAEVAHRHKPAKSTRSPRTAIHKTVGPNTKAADQVIMSSKELLK